MRISAAIRLEYMRCLFRQPISTLDVLPPGQAAAIITITASQLQMGISEKLSQFLQSISLVVSSLVISFIHSWNLTLVTSSGLLVIVAVYGATTPFLVRLLGQVQHADIQASVVANETFNSVRMVAACGAESKVEKRYTDWVLESLSRGKRMPPLVAIQQAPSELPVCFPKHEKSRVLMSASAVYFTIYSSVSLPTPCCRALNYISPKLTCRTLLAPSRSHSGMPSNFTWS